MFLIYDLRLYFLGYAKTILVEHGVPKPPSHLVLENGFKLISKGHTELLALQRRVDMVVAVVRNMQRHSNLSTGDQSLEMKQILGGHTETIVAIR